MNARSRYLLVTVVVGAAALTTSVGCGTVPANPQADAAVDSNGNGGDGGNAGDGGNQACGGENRCVSIPDGWTGPVTYAAQATDPPACAADYPTQALAAHQGLTAGAASCSCTCGAISLTCGAVTGTGYSTTTCTTGQGTIAMGLNSCKLASSFTASGSFDFILSPATSSCPAPTATKNVPTPTWSKNVRVCGGAQDAMPGACGENAICAPPGGAPYGPVCIYQSGDLECPTDFAATRELVFADYSDTRSCSTCTCSKQNANCSATVTRYQNLQNNCSGSTSGLKVTEQGSNCITKSSQTSFATTSITPNPSATCAKQGGAATGSAVPTTPTTICCR